MTSNGFLGILNLFGNFPNTIYAKAVRDFGESVVIVDNDKSIPIIIGGNDKKGIKKISLTACA